MTTTHPTLGEARLPRNPLLSEVLSLVSKQKTKAKKIQTLKQYESLHLKSVLIWNFDESVKSMLPDGDVPFNKNHVFNKKTVDFRITMIRRFQMPPQAHAYHSIKSSWRTDGLKLKRNGTNTHWILRLKLSEH